MKLKFSKLTYLTHINTILKYYYVSVIIDVLYVLYLEVHRLILKKTKPQLCFFLKNLFLVVHVLVFASWYNVEFTAFLSRTNTKNIILNLCPFFIDFFISLTIYC